MRLFGVVLLSIITRVAERHNGRIRLLIRKNSPHIMVFDRIANRIIHRELTVLSDYESFFQRLRCTEDDGDDRTMIAAAIEAECNIRVAITVHEYDVYISSTDDDDERTHGDAK